MSLLWVRAMQFRCFGCGHKFHDGPPPMEALSDEQFGVVNDRSRTMDEHDSHAGAFMPGGRFDGMSPHQFCTSCLSAAVHYPKAYESKSDLMRFEAPRDKKYKFSVPGELTGTCKSCGHTETAPDWPSANRAMTRHAIEHEYGDTSDFVEHP
jgi:hypothetical protein